MNTNKYWEAERDELIDTIVELGFPKELGLAIVKNLGWPKAMRRMTAYLRYARPAKAETVVDEMLAICGEIDSWKEKKGNEEANAAYNDVLRYGLDRE